MLQVELEKYSYRLCKRREERWEQVHPCLRLNHLCLGIFNPRNVDPVRDNIGFFIFVLFSYILFSFSVFGFCWLILADCQFNTAGKRNFQLKNWLYQTGLWACLWGVIANWRKRAHLTVVPSLDKQAPAVHVAERESGSKAVGNAPLWFLLQGLALNSCLGFPEWWTVTCNMK